MKLNVVVEYRLGSIFLSSKLVISLKGIC